VARFLTERLRSVRASRAPSVDQWGLAEVACWVDRLNRAYGGMSPPERRTTCEALSVDWPRRTPERLGRLQCSDLADGLLDDVHGIAYSLGW